MQLLSCAPLQDAAGKTVLISAENAAGVAARAATGQEAAFYVVFALFANQPVTVTTVGFNEL
jgi:hypothetical protein